MYFTVDPDDVGAAAAPLSHLANAVANLDLAADLAPLALALPASNAAATVPELSAHWTMVIARLREGATGQAARLQRASTSYAGAEASAHGSLSAGRTLLDPHEGRLPAAPS